MSQLRLDQYVMPAANLGPESPLVPFVTLDTAGLVTSKKPGPGLTDQDVKHIGYGYVPGCLPYLVQDGYDRKRRPRAFRTAVLENDILRATFLLELGGRLWSLWHKPTGRELLHVNPVFQPANLGIRNAWFSGGVEWNFCWIGHTPFTCAPLFAAKAEFPDGTPVLRMWEWERVRQMAYQIDAYLPDGSPVLLVRVRLANPDDRTVPVYWWSNIAVPEQPDARVVAPADAGYVVGEQTLSLAPYPVREGRDLSYAVNRPHGGDVFFRLLPGHYPWIASIDGRGKGFFHSSTARLIGRKLWVFGQGAGGRRWQDVLNTPGHPYVEIQGGLTHTQAECVPLPPRTEWEWLEAYGSLATDARTVHGPDWPAARGEVEGQINRNITFEQIEQELTRGRAMAVSPPVEVLQRGSGWGELELRRRRKAGASSFLSSSLVFGPETLSAEQAPWLELLETGRFPDAPPEQPPHGWMVQDQWRELLEESVRSGRSDHWHAWLHLGIMHIAAGQAEQARRAWEKSAAMKPSAWGCRNLAALAALQERFDEAARLYPLAVELAPSFLRLVIECGRAMLSANLPGQWLAVLDNVDADTRRNGHVRLLEAQAALAVDDLERAYGVLSDNLELTNIREGDGGPAELWFAYQEKRIARAEGVPIDDLLRQRVRREFPPPKHLDYRLS